MSNRFQLEPAYVLHSRPWSESSLLIEVFSREHGRIGMIARGARKSKSRWQGLLQPFQPLLLSWSARGELGTLTGVERVSTSGSLQEIALFCGFYLNELIIRLCVRNDPHPRLFADYTTCLEELRSGHAPQPSLRAFEKSLLQEIGFELQLTIDANLQRPVSAEKSYRYDPGAGAVEAGQEQAGRVYAGSVLLALANDDYSDRKLMAEMRRLLQGVLAHHLGSKPLASQQILHSLLS